MVLVSDKLSNDCRYHGTGMGVVTDFDASVLLRQRPHVKPMGSSSLLVIQVTKAKLPRARRGWRTWKSLFINREMSTLCAISRAITWCSPKMTKSQLPLPLCGVDSTVCDQGQLHQQPRPIGAG